MFAHAALPVLVAALLPSLVSADPEVPATERVVETPAAVSSTIPRRHFGLFRTWKPDSARSSARTSLPLTAKARSLMKASAPPKVDCALVAMPAMLDSTEAMEFVERGDEILIRRARSTRTIYMKPGAAPAAREPSPAGVSFGRWEGRTLAIFTTHIDAPFFDGAGTPQSAAVTVLERYTPSDDEQRLDWVATVTDPATFTKPVVRTGAMAVTADLEESQRDCAATSLTESARGTGK